MDYHEESIEYRGQWLLRRLAKGVQFVLWVALHLALIAFALWGLLG